MIDKNQNYIVIGASNNTNKYGYKVFYDLISNGYNAIPINPNEKIILNQKVYDNILSFKGKIDNIIFVTQPSVTEKTLEEIIKPHKDIKNIRLQPGSESKKSIDLCKNNNIPYTSNSCIMIERKKP